MHRMSPACNEVQSRPVEGKKGSFIGPAVYLVEEGCKRNEGGPHCRRSQKGVEESEADKCDQN